MKVTFEEIEAMAARRREINSVPFTDIEWTRGGKPVSVSPELASDWRLTGLSNTTFPEFYDGDAITVLVVQ